MRACVSLLVPHMMLRPLQATSCDCLAWKVQHLSSSSSPPFRKHKVNPLLVAKSIFILLFGLLQYACMLNEEVSAKLKMFPFFVNRRELGNKQSFLK